MRRILSLSLGIAGLAGLAACAENDEAFRNNFRAQAIQACIEGGRASNPAGIDANRFCPCMVDRYMQGTPSEQLKNERGQSTPPPTARAAIEQCAREVMGGAQPGSAPPAGNGQTEAPESDEAATDPGENSQ